jgi:hypothetical protein
MNENNELGQLVHTGECGEITFGEPEPAPAIRQQQPKPYEPVRPPAGWANAFTITNPKPLSRRR